MSDDKRSATAPFVPDRDDLSFESVLFGQESTAGTEAKRPSPTHSRSPVSEKATDEGTTTEELRTRSVSGSSTYKSLETGTKPAHTTKPVGPICSRAVGHSATGRRTRGHSGKPPTPPRAGNTVDTGLLPEPVSGSTRETRARSWSDRVGAYEILDVNAVFVANVEPGTDFQALIRHFQAQGGRVAAYHFKAGQRFGFIQFTAPEDCQAAVDAVNDSLFQTSHLRVEKCPRFTPGRDPRLTNPDPSTSSRSSSCTLVLKNLPFHLRQEKLQDILAKMDIRPQFVNYHLDRTGAFRGMAFVKFRHLAQAQRAHDFISGMEISNRKIRVEFKQRKNKDKPALEFDLNDPEVQRIYNQLIQFKESMLNEMCFPPTLTSAQRKTVHTIAESLSLAHVSLGEGEGRFVTVSRKAGSGPATTVPVMISASPVDVIAANGNGHGGGRSRTRSDTSHFHGAATGRSRTRSDTSYLSGRSPASSYGKSPSSIRSYRAEDMYHPPRQPKAPEQGSRGFRNGGHRRQFLAQQRRALAANKNAELTGPSQQSYARLVLVRGGQDPALDSDYNTI